MRRNTYVVAAIATTIGLVAACGNSSNSSNSSTTATSATASSATSSSGQSTTAASSAPTSTTGSGSTDLPSLVPTPTGSQRTDGPTGIHDNGIHTHFLVTGSPSDVMSAYKTALEGKGWSVSVENSGGGYGGGGATYTGTNGSAYGVFTGGGYSGTTDVNACAWPSKPSNTDCGQGN